MTTRTTGGHRRRLRAALIAGCASLAALGAPAAQLAAAPAAGAATTAYQRGPNPTTASISASRGSFAISQTTVSRLAAGGFGGGTIYYPTSTAEGTYGAVAISPGFSGTQSSIAWLGPRIASQGFVVITIDTLTLYDQPASRGDQLLSALDYLTQRSSSTVRSRIDSSRLAVMGHSMGGGGTLEAAKDRPSLQAAIPLTGWNLDKTWPEVRTPTLVVGSENDTIAPVASHSIPFYTSLPSTLDKAYLEINNGTHFTPNSSNTTIAKYSISWLKRFVDDDTRYEQFLCGTPHQADLTSGVFSDYRDTCPHS